MPPPLPSHNSGPAGNGQSSSPHVIRITRLSLLGVAMLLFGVVFPIGGAPTALSWLLLLPVVALAWVLRTQTTVSPDGLRARRLIGSRTLAWTDVKGVRFPKYRFARAVLLDGSEVALPAVDFDRLPELVRFSGGRIPDPYAMPHTEDIPADQASDEQADKPGDEAE